MLMFTLAIFCLTTSHLPWLMYLIFQVPMQYYSLHHWILFSPLDTSTDECCLCFGPDTSFLLELLIAAFCSSPAAYWTPLHLGNSFFGVISFWPLIQFMRISQQVYWGGLPFPLPVDHVLSETFAMTHLSWVALWSMAHSFTEFCKLLCHNKAVIHERGSVLMT